jgi:menaquinone-dependent protoporphyrinogen oxidase
MAAPILVAYATRYGSTREVAESIGATLRAHGNIVDVRPAKDVETLDEYRAVVLGAPLYIGKLLADAQHFLARFQVQFAGTPLAIFALGPVNDDEEEIKGAREQLDKELAKHQWLAPIAVNVFVGRYDPAHLGFLHKLMAAMPATPLHGLSATDERDWQATRDWANDLVGKFQSTTGH